MSPGFEVTEFTLALPVNICVSLGEPFNLSVPLVPRLLNGLHNTHIQ